MSDGFRVTPEILIGAAQTIDGSAQEMATALQSLQTTVTSQSPWGADEAGTVFGLLYTEVLGKALDVFASHLDLLGQAGNGLQEWAQRTVDVDSGQAAAISSVMPENG